jgi:hypothetical protein
MVASVFLLPLSSRVLFSSFAFATLFQKNGDVALLVGRGGKQGGREGGREGCACTVSIAFFDISS